MEPDMNDVKEQHWDHYLSFCHAEGTTPSYKDFLVWWEDSGEAEYL